MERWVKVCGIVGVSGLEQAKDVLVRGLKRLEYRGYDSAGIAVAGPKGLEVARVKGAVERLDRYPVSDATVGIGHTRWATHGKPTEANAHPHSDCTSDFAVVHNGIIENYAYLREELTARGHHFTSETDTEVIAHLVEEHYQGSLVAAVRDALARVEGSYAVAVLANREPDAIVVARHKSPLLVGLAEGATLCASDATALLEHTRRVVYLEDGQIAKLKPSGPEIFNPEGKPVEPQVSEISWSLEDAEKGGFEHFMLKEIHEIPRALTDVLRGRIHSVERDLDLEGTLTREDLARADRILILACGTSFHAGAIGKTLIERLAGVPVEVQLASEYRYGTPFPSGTTLAICVSQSGETADTLEAMRLAKSAQHLTLAITNVAGSTLTREAEGVLHIRAGPEVSVAATKTFVNTVAAFYLIALHLAATRQRLSPPEVVTLAQEMARLPGATRRVIESSETLREIAERLLAPASHAFFLGRQLSFGVALEGALKVKEIAYIHAEGYGAGELKHGPLALLNEDVPVIACAPRDRTYDVMMSNVREVRARDARVLAVVDEHDPDAEKHADETYRLPSVHPVFFVVPATVALYLLSYHAARARGCEIDRPRNLAKSVTVE